MSACLSNVRETTPWSVSTSNGLTRYSLAPACMARTAVLTSPTAVTTMTPRYSSISLMRWRTSKPSMSGKRRSRMTRRISSWARTLRAAAASGTVRTSQVSSSTTLYDSSTPGSSSTANTKGLLASNCISPSLAYLAARESFEYFERSILHSDHGLFCCPAQVDEGFLVAVSTRARGIRDPEHAKTGSLSTGHDALQRQLSAVGVAHDPTP